MDKSQPLYFLNNSFVFLDGHREYFNGEKEYTTLPNKEKYKVNKNNVWSMIRSVYIPISQMCANVKGYQFCNSIDGIEKIAFYDLECDSKENFELGYINDIKFTNPEEMVKELMKYEIIVGFNTINFDNEVLSKYSRDSFYEIKNAEFIGHFVKNTLNIDLFSIIKTLVGREGYSQESIAKELNFNEEILNHDAPKEKKCIQDIKILKLIWKEYDIPLVFNTISKLINLDVGLSTIIKKDRVRKWILINSYLKRGYLPLMPEYKEIKMTSEPVKLCKEGFYEGNYLYLDIKGAYPQTAINLGNLGIYDNDNTFSELQKELSELAKNPKLKPFMKSIQNPLFGSQYSQNERFKDEEIFNTIVKTVADKVSNEIKRIGNVIYSNTDCFIIDSKNERPTLECYEIVEKYKFSELYIYSVNKWLGKTKERIEFRGFKRLNSRNPKILQVAREEILSKLKKLKGDDFKEALEEPEKLVSKTIKGLKKFDKEYFKFVIRKKDDYCWDVSLMDVWKELQIGFNEIYYKESNVHTTNPKNINYKYYEQLILELANEYKPVKE